MKLQEKLNKVLQIKHFLIQKTVLSIVKQKDIGVYFEDGYEIEHLSSNQFADVDPDELFWYYDGPLDDKTREFCVELLILGKFFRQSDIDKLSSKAGYDVDSYKGSFGCRHKWKLARIKGRIKEGYIPDTPSGNEINKVGRQSIK